MMTTLQLLRLLPTCESIRGEAPKDHCVDRSQARTGQHGDGQLQNHGHVDRDSIALLDALGFQPVSLPQVGQQYST